MIILSAFEQQIDDVCGRYANEYYVVTNPIVLCRWKIHLGAGASPRGRKDGMDFGAAQDILATHHLDQLEHDVQQT